MRQLVVGTYNFEFGGFDQGNPARLHRQLAMLAEVQADAWAFQECSNWQDDRTRTQGMVEETLGMRGFFARSNRGPGGDVAVFIRESAGIRFIEPRHEEQPQPYWHAVAHIITEVDGFGLLRLASAHLAPASPNQRTSEAESFQLLAEKDAMGPLVIGGDWNAFPRNAPDPGVNWAHEGKRRRKTDTRAAEALAEFMTDVGELLDIRTPTVGHRGDRVPYQCDRIYTTLDAAAITGFEVVQEEGDPLSDHRPAFATFNLSASMFALSA
jgi:endonuclease/exonuclease/phosphatase family metal-dependent hydrolase